MSKGFSKRNGWGEVKLGGITNIFTGRKNVNQTNPHGKYYFFSCSPDEFFSDEYIYDGDAIIITGNGSYTGTIRFFSGKFDLYQRTYACVLLDRHVNEFCSKFIFYYLKKFFEQRYIGGTRGSSIPYILKGDIENFNIPKLPLIEQKAIAEVLSSLDDKIDLLHRQNKTLEAMAQALFRKWFVEDEDERWEEVKLENFVKCTTGHSYRSNELKPSNIALVTLKNFARDGSFRMDGYKEFIGKFKDDKIVRQSDLVVAHTDITQDADIIGNPALVIHPKEYEILVMTMDLMKVESTEEWLSKEFLFYLFKSLLFKSHCLGCSNGTTVLHMNRKAVPSYKFKIPNKEKIILFTEIVKPNIEKTFKNITAINILENMRDTLLPKFMSGKARIALG